MLHLPWRLILNWEGTPLPKFQRFHCMKKHKTWRRLHILKSGSNVRKKKQEEPIYCPCIGYLFKFISDLENLTNMAWRGVKIMHKSVVGKVWLKNSNQLPPWLYTWAASQVPWGAGPSRFRGLYICGGVLGRNQNSWAVSANFHHLHPQSNCISTPITKKKCIIHQYFQPLVVQPTNTFLPTTVATQGVDFSAGGPENAPDLTRTRDHLGWVELPQGARPAWQMTGPSREPQPPRVFNHRSPRGIPSGGMCCGTSLPPPKPWKSLIWLTTLLGGKSVGYMVVGAWSKRSGGAARCWTNGSTNGIGDETPLPMTVE